MMSDDLTLVIGGAAGRKLSGWQQLRVTRGVERLPSDFDITFTERFPGEVASVVVKEGDECQVLLGSDLVLTGYVDRFIPAIDRQSHSLRVMGRGKCQDLVDCSAEWPSNQISSADVLSIAAKLAQPYGITVSALTDVGPPIPQINLMWGETPFAVIERIARFRALLAYDGPDGNLVLSRVGTVEHASGFAQGANVESAVALFSMDQRFSEYVVRSLSMAPLGEAGPDGDIQAIVRDAGVTRHRKRFIIAESGIVALGLSEQRGRWEMARRAGRSFQVRLTVDSWRDAAGELWTPNRLARVTLPSLHLDATWIIAEVTYQRGPSGTSASLVLMPPSAFELAPTVLVPVLSDVTPGARP
ncbi:phage baseplate assembly protein [Azospirillum cavernae]|nr:hypothetical protein [Azospirillum cavernae]